MKRLRPAPDSPRPPKPDFSERPDSVPPDPHTNREAYRLDSRTILMIPKGMSKKKKAAYVEMWKKRYEQSNNKC